MPVDSSRIKVSAVPSADIYGREEENPGTHHTVTLVLCSLISPPSCFQHSEPFYHGLRGVYLHQRAGARNSESTPFCSLYFIQTASETSEIRPYIYCKSVLPVSGMLNYMTVPNKFKYDELN